MVSGIGRRQPVHRVFELGQDESREVTTNAAFVKDALEQPPWIHQRTAATDVQWPCSSARMVVKAGLKITRISLGQFQKCDAMEKGLAPLTESYSPAIN